MVVASKIDGRIRIRDEGLKKDPVAARVREELEGSEGVTGVETNQRVGSLLVLYDAALTAVEKILKLVADLLGSKQEPQEEGATSGWSIPRVHLPRLSITIPPRLKKGLSNFGMLASLVVSVIFGFFHLKKLHIAMGLLFLALFGQHFYERKEYMF